MASVFKIATRAAWAEACRSGHFNGSPDDLRDGFIHLSTEPQLEGTAARHFKGQSDLVLVQFDATDLGPQLRWEPSRGGELFPHLYAPLPTSRAVVVLDMILHDDGVPRAAIGDS